MSYQVPPIVRLAQRLQVDIENAVRRFARYHKYTLGTDLRASAMQVALFANRAWRDRARQLAWVEDLNWNVDDLKLRMQLGSNIKAFASLGQFESLMRDAVDLGRQVGGWKKQLGKHPNGQNAAASNGRPQRPKTLSTHATSFEVNA